MSRVRIVVLIGAVLAVLLQVLLAPHIAIGYARLNLIAVYSVVMALAAPGTFKHGLPFALGLIYDLMSGGPVGAMAFTCTACAAFTAWFFRRANNDTIFMGMFALIIGLLLIEMVYGTFLLAFGFSANLLEAFVYRTLPCFLYDAVVGLVLYPIALRMFPDKAAMRSEITQLQ